MGRLADSMARSQGLAEPEARVAAAANLDALWPSTGAADPEHLYDIRDGDGPAIGAAWFGLQPAHRGVEAFLWDIVLEPERRGAGLGRRALAAVESTARELGARGIGLNVFGHDRAARALYDGSGYSPVSLQLHKEL